MCGIVGILGSHEAAPFLMEGLRRLEYRGYDSAGIATVNDGTLGRRRAVGKLVNLADLLVHEPLAGKAGIGHTRWATHGAPSVTNAHPHQAGPVAVVHNGIIENYRELRAELAEGGRAFVTETDTEVVALLCERYLAEGLSPADAAFTTLDRLEGAFALCFLFEGEDDLLVAARKGSPLAIGHGEGEMYVGSDALALCHMTDRITYLDEGDRAVITRAGATIRNPRGQLVNRPIRHIELPRDAADKGAHRHFMAKEIAEQPRVLADILAAYTDVGAGQVRLPAGEVDFASAQRLCLTACGTAFFACWVARYWFEELAGLPVDLDIASEYRYREPPVPEGRVGLVVSESGETADTLAALRYLAEQGARTLGLVNAPESSIAREVDLALPTLAGAEIGVASTKAFTGQLTVLAALAVLAARQRGRIDAGREAELVGLLGTLPRLVALALQSEGLIAAVARVLADSRDVLFLGRGTMYPMALEGALKLKEISYIHAEGYASGELKHGPIALIDERVPVVVLAPRDGLFDKTVSNMHEVMARGGKVILLSDAAGAEAAGADAWKVVMMPDADPLLAPILYAVPVQLLAYHTALARGTDIDQPRNLAKSVTVE
ncbi:MAG: glutamine--fructose-6-phosphate transaminase (isomerizing) [Rhodobacteraceae bacterium]|nr:glutamine--fructose-6-phosphate transaminase (isomerizing) [Paracoccaceae bacterium]